MKSQVQENQDCPWNTILFLTAALIFVNLELAGAVELKLRENYGITWFGSSGYTVGKAERCPKDTYATGFQLKIQDNTSDNTGLNGIRLFCANPGTPDDEVTTIESVVGPHGSWGDENDCDGLLLGFHMKGVYYFNNNDDIGATGMNGVCGNPDKQIVEGEELKSEYSELRGAPLKCLRRQAICGIQTYLGNRVNNNDRGLIRVKMDCCNLDDESRLCTPKDSWMNVIGCDNSKNTEVDASLECSYVLETGVEMGTKQAAAKYTMASQRASVGISAGFELAGLSANFDANLGVSKATGQEWAKETSDTFSKETKIEAKFSVEPGVKSAVEQVVGSCGSFFVRPNVLRRTNAKKGQRIIPSTKVLELTISNYTLEAVKDLARFKEFKLMNAKQTNTGTFNTRSS